MKKLLVLMVLAVSVFAQTKDPYKILEEVKTKLDKVNDYSVEVSINIDASFVQMPESRAKVYYKKPDKFRIKSQGFAMLPKQGMTFSPAKFLNKEYDALYIKSDTLDNMNVDVVKIIPRSDSSEIILASLWVDTQNNVIRKVEASTNSAGNFEMKFNYKNAIIFGLPDEMIFLFSVKNMRLPNIAHHSSEEPKNKENKSIEGTVSVKYSNYIINKGIEDKIFEEEER